MKRSNKVPKAGKNPKSKVPLPSQTQPATAGTGCMSPELMFKEAEAEEDRKFLDGYSDTIRTLRDEKNFSYREIADWMNERGMSVDHNSVYRVYMNCLHVDDREKAELRDAVERLNEGPLK